MGKSCFHVRRSGLFLVSSFLIAGSLQAGNLTDVTLPSQTVLRDAIASGGLVRLSFDGTITLTNTIEITSDVVLDGQGHAVTIDGNKAVRLFRIKPGVSFSATNVTFANGFHTGDAVAAEVPGNPGEGGAILNEGGMLNLKSCVLMGNSVAGGLGGVSNFGPMRPNAAGGEARGGAILVRDGSMKLDSVQILNNTATGGGTETNLSMDPLGRSLGGAVYMSNSIVSIINSTIGSNGCVQTGGFYGGEAWGGGLFIDAGDLTLSNIWLNANVAQGFGASFYGGYSSYGGGMGAVAGSVKIARCLITSNSVTGGYGYNGVTAGQGGAIFSAAAIRVTDTTFSYNNAVPGASRAVCLNGCGGAFYNSGNAELSRCLFTANTAFGAQSGWVMPGKGSAGNGGAIFNQGQLAITNCTVSGNLSRGAYVSGDAYGGGIFNSNGVLQLVNSTIASNSVISGDSSSYSYSTTTAGANLVNKSGDFLIKNSIVAYPVGSSNVWGTITDTGYNICSDNSANLFSGSSFNSTDPQLNPLADNGGPTQTMSLALASPALDFAPLTGAPAQDQRGLSRPVGSGIDAGAFELQAGEGSPSNRVQYTLTIHTNGIGSITRLPNLTTYPQGSTVRLIASPDSASYFAGWTGDVAVNTRFVDVVMGANQAITANFLPLPQFTVSILTNGMGSVLLDPPAGPYLSNSTVTATATPAPGWIFLGWAGDVSGANNPVTLQMDSIKTVSATFVQLPGIALAMHDLSAQIGTDASFSIQPVGTPPLSYQWWFGSDKLDGFTNSSILLKNVQPAMQGAYSVTVSNPYGSVTNSAMLSIIVPPSISLQPIARTNVAGTKVTFTTIATGSDPLTYLWTRNSIAMTNGARFSGATTATLTITNVQTIDVADYAVVVSNPWGSVTSSLARLTVVTKPALTREPIGKTNFLGSTAAFAASASGTAPLAFRWLKNGVDITNGVSNPGPTNSMLTLANLQTNDSANYWVVVSNSWGTATSRIATLVVMLDQVAPVLTITSHTNMQVVGTNRITLAGTATDADRGDNGIALVTVNGTPVAASGAVGSSAATWSCDITLAVGTNNLAVAATDHLGNATTNLMLIVLDVTKPTVAITNLVSNQRWSNSVMTIKGTANDKVGNPSVLWRLNGGDWHKISETQKTWSAEVTLSTRSNTFQVYAIDAAGNTSATNSANITYISCSSLTLRTNGIGTITLNANLAQLEVGRTYSAIATPGKGCVFSNWVNGTGAVLSGKGTLSFTMQSNLTLVANFVTNPFTARSGNYAGLFYSTNSDGITVTNAGYFTANVQANGAFTAQIRQRGTSYAFSGQFSVAGAWETNSIKNAPHIGAALQLDMAGNQSLVGQFSGTTWTSPLLAVRNIFSAADPAPYKGQYTMVIPGADATAGLPGGCSAMALTVTRTGALSVNGVMADGEPVSASTFVSGEGRWPFYGSLYGKTGLVLGWLNFSGNATNNIDGAAVWIKPAKSTSKIYPQGWSYYGADVLGSTFTNKAPIAGWTNGVVVLEGASLSRTVSNGLKVNAAGQITGTNSLKLTLTKAGPTAGLFSGTVVTDSRTKASITVKGALLQNQQIGQGWFINTNQSGRVLLMEQ